MPPAPCDVFVSCSSRDRAVARDVVAALEGRGVRCRAAPRDEASGEDRGEAVLDEVSACRVMVLVFSSGANGSPEVERQVQKAVEAGLTRVALRVENVAPAKALAPYLRPAHWLDAMPLTQERLRALVGTVGGVLTEARAEGPRGDSPEGVMGDRPGPLPGGPADASDDARAEWPGEFSPAAPTRVGDTPALEAPPPEALPATPGPSSGFVPRVAAGAPAGAGGRRARETVRLERTGALEYATPRSARWAGRGRVLALVLAAGLAGAALSWPGWGGGARWVTRVPPATVPSPAVPSPSPPGAYGLQAVDEILEDLRALDRHAELLGRFGRAGPPAADSPRAALEELAESPASFYSYGNVAGTTRGSYGGAGGMVPDRLAALGGLGAGAPAVRAFADDLFSVTQALSELPRRYDRAAARLAVARVAAGLKLDSPESPAGFDREQGFAARSLAAGAEESRLLARRAYVSGLALLDRLRPHLPPDAPARLAAVTCLEPRELISQSKAGELTRAVEASLSRAGRLEAALADEGARAWEEEVDGWSARLMPPYRLAGRPLPEALALTPAPGEGTYRPEPGESEARVRARARWARDDGRPETAAALFACYAAMFSDSDADAEEYARAGVLLTLQRHRFGGAGGMYLARLGAGPAKDGGLRSGDVLLTFGGQDVPGPDEWAQALKQAPPADPVRVEYLRRDDRGRYQRRTATLPRGGSLGAALLGI